MATPAFLAGGKLRASELNSFVLLTGRCTADTTFTSSTTLANVTGLAVALEANATYVFDGFYGFTALSTTPDAKFAFTIPTGATGHWSLHALSTGASVPGTLNAAHSTSFTTAQTAGTDGTLGVAALPHGYVVTTNSGTMQVQAAQNTSSATTLTIHEGSWIRFQRVA